MEIGFNMIRWKQYFLLKKYHKKHIWRWKNVCTMQNLNFIF